MRKTVPLMLLCSFALIASTPKRTSNPAPGPFNFELVMDSATILADDYAEAMANKPEMVKSRMNALKRFYAPYSANKTVADSICNVIFNMYVDNIERDTSTVQMPSKNVSLKLPTKTMSTMDRCMPLNYFWLRRHLIQQG